MQPQSTYSEIKKRLREIELSYRALWNISCLREDRKEDTFIGTFLVESVFKAKKCKGGVRFLTRWQGYHPIDDTWEPEDHLINTHFFLDEKVISKSYKAKHVESQQKRKSTTLSTDADKTRRVPYFKSIIRQLQTQLKRVTMMISDQNNINRHCFLKKKPIECVPTTHSIHNTIDFKRALSSNSSLLQHLLYRSITIDQNNHMKIKHDIHYAKETPSSYQLICLLTLCCPSASFPFLDIQDHPLLSRTTIIVMDHNKSSLIPSSPNSSLCLSQISQTTFFSLLNKLTTYSTSIISQRCIAESLNIIPPIRFDHVETECFRLLGLPRHPIDSACRRQPYSIDKKIIAVYNDHAILSRIWFPNFPFLPLTSSFESFQPLNKPSCYTPDMYSSAIGNLLPKRIIDLYEFVQSTQWNNTEDSKKQFNYEATSQAPQLGTHVSLFYEIEWFPTINGEERPRSIIQSDYIDLLYPWLSKRYDLQQSFNIIIQSSPVSFILAIPSILFPQETQTLDAYQKDTRFVTSQPVSHSSVPKHDGWSPSAASEWWIRHCLYNRPNNDIQHTSHTNKDSFNEWWETRRFKCVVTPGDTSTKQWTFLLISGACAAVCEYIQFLFEAIQFYMHNYLHLPQTTFTAFVFLPSELRQALGSYWELLGVLSQTLGPSFTLPDEEIYYMDRQPFGSIPDTCPKARHILNFVALPNFDEFGRLRMSQSKGYKWTLNDRHLKLFRMSRYLDSTMSRVSDDSLTPRTPLPYSERRIMNSCTFTKLGGRYPLGLHGESALIGSLLLTLTREIALTTYLTIGETITHHSPMISVDSSVTDLTHHWEKYVTNSNTSCSVISTPSHQEKHRIQNNIIQSNDVTHQTLQNNNNDVSNGRQIQFSKSSIPLAIHSLYILLKNELKLQQDKRSQTSCLYRHSLRYMDVCDIFCQGIASNCCINEDLIWSIFKQAAKEIATINQLHFSDIDHSFYVPEYHSWTLLERSTDLIGTIHCKLQLLQNDFVQVADLCFGLPYPVEDPVPARVSPIDKLYQTEFKRNDMSSNSVIGATLGERFTTIGLKSLIKNQWKTVNDIPKMLLHDRRDLWMCRGLYAS